MSIAKIQINSQCIAYQAEQRYIQKQIKNLKAERNNLPRGHKARAPLNTRIRDLAAWNNSRRLEGHGRHQHLAKCYLRGRTYEQCERTTHTKASAAKIASILYALDAGPPKAKLTEQIERWLSERTITRAFLTDEYLASLRAEEIGRKLQRAREEAEDLACAIHREEASRKQSILRLQAEQAQQARRHAQELETQAARTRQAHQDKLAEIAKLEQALAPSPKAAA